MILFYLSLQFNPTDFSSLKKLLPSNKPQQVKIRRKAITAQMPQLKEGRLILRVSKEINPRIKVKPLNKLLKQIS